MRRLRFGSTLFTLSTIAALAFTTPASASTGVFTVQIVGPGAIATWTTAPEAPVAGVTYTDTFLGVFDQLNAPGSRGFIQSAQFFQVAYHFDGADAWWDSWTFANMDASVMIREPLKSATATGTGPRTTCIPDENDVVCEDAGTLEFSASWTGTGPISRAPNRPVVDVTPGVAVYVSFGSDVFNRAVEDPDVTFAPEVLPAGSRLTRDWSPAGMEGTKLFKAHFGFISICHGGTPDLNDGLPAPCLFPNA